MIYFSQESISSVKLLISRTTNTAWRMDVWMQNTARVTHGTKLHRKMHQNVLKNAESLWSCLWWHYWSCCQKFRPRVTHKLYIFGHNVFWHKWSWTPRQTVLFVDTWNTCGQLHTGVCCVWPCLLLTSVCVWRDQKGNRIVYVALVGRDRCQNAREPNGYRVRSLKNWVKNKHNTDTQWNRIRRQKPSTTDRGLSQVGVFHMWVWGQRDPNNNVTFSFDLDVVLWMDRMLWKTSNGQLNFRCNHIVHNVRAWCQICVQWDSRCLSCVLLLQQLWIRLTRIRGMKSLQLSCWVRVFKPGCFAHNAWRFQGDPGLGKRELVVSSCEQFSQGDLRTWTSMHINFARRSTKAHARQSDVCTCTIDFARTIKIYEYLFVYTHACNDVQMIKFGVISIILYSRRSRTRSTFCSFPFPLEKRNLWSKSSSPNPKREFRVKWLLQIYGGAPPKEENQNYSANW